MTDEYLPGFADALSFSLTEALFGRRSRRFMLGASIPDGPLAFTSRHDPMPLSDLEQMLVLTAVAGNTGWNYMHMFNPNYAPSLPNYANRSGGRTFSSGAAFHTTEIFYTDDSGVFFFGTRDVPSFVDGPFDAMALVEAHRSRIRKLSDGRLYIPAEEPYMNGHNTWCANRPGTMFIVPVGDLAQHVLAGLCFLLRNGYCIYDDVHNERIPGLERFADMADVEHPAPLTVLGQQCLGELAAEIAMACYAGMLMLQAMGLGGWVYDGLDPSTILGLSGNPEVPGLGFRYETDERWPLPNPTGLPGVFEAYCPPQYPDMRAAVETLAERKFGFGGPFNPETPGPWKDSPGVRGSAAPFTDRFKECVALQAQYVYDRFGKWPGTVPSVLTVTFLQAHHLDLEFYDHHFGPGAYLRTHAEHMARWHP